jgi:hypothetical protein
MKKLFILLLLFLLPVSVMALEYAIDTSDVTTYKTYSGDTLAGTVAENNLAYYNILDDIFAYKESSVYYLGLPHDGYNSGDAYYLYGPILSSDALPSASFSSLTKAKGNIAGDTSTGLMYLYSTVDGISAFYPQGGRIPQFANESAAEAVIGECAAAKNSQDGITYYDVALATDRVCRDGAWADGGAATSTFTGIKDDDGDSAGTNPKIIGADASVTTNVNGSGDVVITVTQSASAYYTEITGITLWLDSTSPPTYTTKTITGGSSTVFTLPVFEFLHNAAGIVHFNFEVPINLDDTVNINMVIDGYGDTTSTDTDTVEFRMNYIVVQNDTVTTSKTEHLSTDNTYLITPYSGGITKETLSIPIAHADFDAGDWIIGTIYRDYSDATYDDFDASFYVTSISAYGTLKAN